jgi:hypothetical protein
VKPKLKLFFDECVSSPRLIKALQQFYTDIDGNCEADIVRLQEKFVSGEDDSVWLTKLQSEGGWIVITKDQGRSTGPKLPTICPKLGITHVVLLGTLDHAGVEAWKQAFVDVWQTLKLAPTLQPGTKIKMRYLTTNPPKAALFVGNCLLKEPSTAPQESP